jgi:hypothetical protein
MLRHLARNLTLASALSLPVVGVVAPQALADKDNFYIYNNSSRDIYFLYISQSDLPAWQDDVLGSEILYAGDGFQVVFGDPNPTVCLYDFRAELEDGEVVENYEINVCANDYYQVFDE